MRTKNCTVFIQMWHTLETGSLNLFSKNLIRFKFIQSVICGFLLKGILMITSCISTHWFILFPKNIFAIDLNGVSAQEFKSFRSSTCIGKYYQKHAYWISSIQTALQGPTVLQYCVVYVKYVVFHSIWKWMLYQEIHLSMTKCSPLQLLKEGLTCL